MKTPDAMRPLIIALHLDYWNQFYDGTKTVEYRLYGPRWNERTCQPGRKAVLSAGYSKRRRITMRIGAFATVPYAAAPPEARAIYWKHPRKNIACIQLEPIARERSGHA